MTKTEIRQLADQARNDPRVARGAFRKLAIANGFEGRSGGWIHDTNRPGSPTIAQGWQNLAALVHFGGVTFASGVDMDAIHAEALREEIGEEPGEWQAGIDAAHGEALAENADHQGILDAPQAEVAAAPVDHRAPLAPGEIRSQWVGNQFFQVMHIAGGSFTQATVRTSGPDRPRVLATEMFESDAVRAYADAIEQAEDDAARSAPDDQCGCERNPLGHLRSEHPTALPAEESWKHPYTEQGGRCGTCGFGRTSDRHTAPAPTLADDVATLRAVLVDLATGLGGVVKPDILAILDRIAARAPQRATDADEFSKGDPLWLHECGGVMPGEGEREPYECPRHWCTGGTWRPLYVLPDGA